VAQDGANQNEMFKHLDSRQIMGKDKQIEFAIEEEAPDAEEKELD